jgi:hypothetical protein
MAFPLPTKLTYSKLYSEDTMSPFGTETKAGYATVFNSWRVDARPPTVGKLLEDVVADFARPMGGIGIFVEDSESATGHLVVAHGLQPFHGIPGRNTQDRKLLFGFKGDVVGVDIATVAMDNTQWEITVAVNVPGTATRVLQLLGAEPEDELIVPFRASEANVRQIKTRGGMYIPFEFMPIVLGQDLTAREAYLLLVPAIIDAGLEAVCQPLIDFLTVVIVEPTATSLEPLTVKPCLGRLHHNPSPTVISNRRAEVPYRDLPGLKQGPSDAGDPYLRDVARAVGELAVEARSDRNDRLYRRAILDLPKSARDKFGDRVTDRFLLLCRVEDDDNLPLLYHEWAARPKWVSERYVMHQSVDVACATLSLPSFQVSPAHVMAFKNLQFAGGQYFDIGTGLLPFSITPTDAQSSAARVMLAADQGRVDAFDLGADPETSAIAPGDVPRLRNSQGYLPHGWIEAGSQLRSACGLLGALLGPARPVVRAYLCFLTKYGRLQTRLSLELDH